MLNAAEAEFFGQQGQDGAGAGAGAGAAGVAEAKPAAPQQAYFKSAKGGGGGGDGGLSRGGGRGGSDVAGAAQSKVGRRGAAGGGFKPVRSEGESQSCVSSGVCLLRAGVRFVYVLLCGGALLRVCVKGTRSRSKVHGLPFVCADEGFSLSKEGTRVGFDCDAQLDCDARVGSARLATYSTKHTMQGRVYKPPHCVCSPTTC